MKYIPYPPTCRISLVEVDKNEKNAILHVDTVIKANRDGEYPIPGLENKTIHFSISSLLDVYEKIENLSGKRPLRLDPAK